MDFASRHTKLERRAVRRSGGNDVILVRDTTDPDGTMLAFSAATWQTFVTRLK